MEYSYLGKTGLKVSRLCLGTMNFGPLTEERVAYAIMDKALEDGVNFFDTANVYGKWPEQESHNGWTEEIIGRWFALGGGRRESVVLATKVYGQMEDATYGPNSGNGLSGYKIRRQLEDSLRRLQTDHVELYQMHHIDRHPTWDELWGVFENVIAAGKVDYIGSSNFAARHLCYAQAAAASRHFLGLVSEQHKYSLLIRQPELEVLPAAEELGLGVIPWSPLAGGLLGARGLDGTGGTRSNQATEALDPAARDQLTRYVEVCAALGDSPANVALAWTLVHPAVTAPIIGPRTVDQFTESLRAVQIKLDPATLSLLDEIFPGPGGAAPEAYAW
jgi:aryl-alcohol dehydrogenase-like predicted oxidoreductase